MVSAIERREEAVHERRQTTDLCLLPASSVSITGRKP
jgi:hypothetical protein